MSTRKSNYANIIIDACFTVGTGFKTAVLLTTKPSNLQCYKNEHQESQ